MNDEQYFQLFRKRGAFLLKARKEFVAMIPRIYKKKMYKKHGFGSIYECAAKIGGVSHAVVDSVIRVDERLEDKPLLKALLPKVGLSKIKRVISVATKETDEEWAEKVQKLSKPVLETHIRDIKNSVPRHRKLIEPEKSIYVKEHQDYTMKLDPKTIQKLKHLKANMKAGTTWNDVINFLLDNKKLKKQRARNLKAEAKITCEHPGCNKPATEIHHENPYAISQNHENLKSYCKDHYELAHQSNSTIDQKFRMFKFQQASMF